jgi:hypothetical protein
MAQELKVKKMGVHWLHLTYFGHTLEYRWSALECVWMTLDDLGGLLLLIVQSGIISLVPGRSEFGSFIISRLLS